MLGNSRNDGRETKQRQASYKLSPWLQETNVAELLNE